MKIKAASLFLLFTVSFLSSACGPSTSRHPDSVGIESLQPLPKEETLPEEESVSTPLVDLSNRPLVFFSPLPHPAGSLDFMDLFTPDAPWETVVRHIDIFKLYGGWVAHFPWEPPEATDLELRRIVSDLNLRGIAIAFESSPLVATETCGQGIEGFFGPEEGLAIVRKLKSLGADVRYVTFDEPYAFGHIYAGEQACRWTAEKIARQVWNFVTALRQVYPDAVYGDIEPLWSGVDPQEFIGWMEAYQSVTGETLPFIHLDPDYSRPDWPLAVKQIEEAARARGVEFGIIYFGDAGDVTDDEWVAKAFERARQYELVAGGSPDHVIFQSWHPRPDYVLPETDPVTFTGLIWRYFLPRPMLSLDLDFEVVDGYQSASGALISESGEPIPGAALELRLSSMDDTGLISNYTITGTVPSNAVKANVGLRVNTECGGCRAASDLYLYEVTYVEGSEAASRVPNNRFSSGWQYWGAWGLAPLKLVPSDRGSGAMLHLSASREQDAGLNSGSFPVTPGSSYTLTFTARIPPASVGSGYFAVFFLDASREITRITIPFSSGSVSLGSAVTDALGLFTLQFPALSAGTYVVSADFPGDAHFWPAYTTEEISIP